MSTLPLHPLPPPIPTPAAPLLLPAPLDLAHYTCHMLNCLLDSQETLVNIGLCFGSYDRGSKWREDSTGVVAYCYCR